MAFLARIGDLHELRLVRNSSMVAQPVPHGRHAADQLVDDILGRAL
jgi:hypothetical protein